MISKTHDLKQIKPQLNKHNIFQRKRNTKTRNAKNHKPTTNTTQKKTTILEHTIRQSNRNKRHLNKHTVLNAYKTIPLTKHSNIDKYNIKNILLRSSILKIKIRTNIKTRNTKNSKHNTKQKQYKETALETIMRQTQ